MSHLHSPVSLSAGTIRAFSTYGAYASINAQYKKRGTSGLTRLNDGTDITLLKRAAVFGPDKSPLPFHLQEVRLKHKLDDPQYSEYWKIVAQAKLLEGKGAVYKNVNKKANAKLVSLLQGERDLKHKQLMREAQSIRDRRRQAVKDMARLKEKEAVAHEEGKDTPSRQAEDAAAPLQLTEDTAQSEQRDEANTTSQQTEETFNLTTFLEEVRIPSECQRVLRKTEEKIHKLQGRIRRRRQNRQYVAETEIQGLPQSPTSVTDGTLSEVRAMTEAHVAQQWEKVHGINQLLEKYKQQFEDIREQARKREEIRKRKEEILAKKRILLKQLQEQEHKEVEAKRIPKPANSNNRQDEPASDDLDAILKYAMENVGKDLEEPRRPRRDIVAESTQATVQLKEDVKAQPKRVVMSSISVLAESKPENGGQEAKSKGAKTDASPPERPSDSLRLRIPPSGFVPIDDNLIITFEGSVPELQSEVFEMTKRLRTSYPRIHTLPYDIWTSQNKATLQTWLKILVKKWQTRFDSIEQTGQVERDIVDGRIRTVLDRMISDHDLSNEAAERMAMRWYQVFDQRGTMHGDAEGVIDWDEFHAEGLGFLAKPEVVMRERQVETMPSSTATLSSTHKRPKIYKESHNGVVDDPVAHKMYSTSSRSPPPTPDPGSQQKANDAARESQAPSLPHLTSSGSAHMVSVSTKQHTTRTAIAVGSVHFTNPTPLSLIHSNTAKKGDVLGVSRIAGIMAAKKCPDLIPLCHPIPLTHVSVELKPFSGATHSSSSPKEDGLQEEDAEHGGVKIEAKVQCTGPTGVEMEALTAVMGAALSVVDMCKAVDRFQVVKDVRVVFKEGGKSGVWKEEGWKSWQEE